MVVTLIYGITMLIILGSVYVSLRAEGKPSQQIVFGVTLSKEAMNSPEVEALYETYHSKLKKTYGYLILLIVPFILLSPLPYASVDFIYFMAYTVTAIVWPHWVFIQMNKKTAAYKEDHGILKEKKQIVYADLKRSAVSQYKRNLTDVFVIILVLGLIPLSYVLIKGDSYEQLLVAILYGTMVVTFISKLSMANRSKKVYCHDSETNQLIQQYIVRQWDVFFLGVMLSEIVMGFLLVLMKNQLLSSPTFLVVTILVISAYPVLHYMNLQKKANDFVEEMTHDQELLIVDEDVYWKYGLFYNNPQDPSLVVKNRVGYNSSSNFGHPLGKLIFYGSLALVALIIIPITMFMVVNDTMEPVAVVEEDGIFFDDILYDHKVLFEDINQVTLVESLPTGTRTNGSSTAQYHRGNYSLQPLGQCKVYVMRDSVYVIQIETKARYDVYYSSLDEAKMEEILVALAEYRK